MAGNVDASELAEILKELRDSIREQNTLLNTFIIQQGTLHNTHEDNRNSSHSTPSHADKSNGSRSNELKEDEDEKRNIEQDDLTSLAASYQSLFKHQVAFYYANKTRPEGSYWRLINKLLANKIKAVVPQHRNGVAGKHWKYWIPVFDPTSSDKSMDSGEYLFLNCHSGGRPNYVPPWELRKVGNELFHIDDIRKEEPLGFTEEAIDEFPMIPYSFMPPVPAYVNGEALIAATGITADWGDLHSCLGSLYSVPPDGRIPLSFERNELRLMCASQHISSYLHHIRETFQKLYRNGGSFSITDFDPSMNSATYSWKEGKKVKVRKELYYWKAASHALFSESSGLVVPPSSNRFMMTTPEFKRLTGRNWFEGPDHYYNLSAEDNVIRRPRVTGFVNARNWYRLVHCQGLSSIMPATSESSGSLTDAEKIWSLLIYSSQQRPRLHHKRYSIIQEAFNLHIFCSRVQRAGNHYLSRWKPFHVTWFEILGDNREVDRASSWNRGPLYGSKKKLWIRETAFTLAMLPHCEPYGRYAVRPYPADYSSSLVEENGTNFYTILLLTPSKMGELGMYQDNPATYVLLLIGKGLEKAANAWEDIRAHFNLILDGQNTTLNPEKHDELLFDDDTFSRSRLYFWAVDSLDIFITQIKDTISEWEDFWVARQQMIRAFEKAQWKRTDEYEPSNVNFEQVIDQINRLKDYQIQFETFRAKTLALREGLFNASSVIESRAATRLGENVKLLTYVSVFYLPLAFCAGPFSINESYSTSAFAITSVAVAAGTYIFVGNLENTVTALRSVYRFVKQPIVNRMVHDSEQMWANRGEDFMSFQPDRQTVKPSEWYVVLFRVLEILRYLRVVGNTRKGLKNSLKSGSDTPPINGTGSVSENSDYEDS